MTNVELTSIWRRECDAAGRAVTRRDALPYPSEAWFGATREARRHLDAAKTALHALAALSTYELARRDLDAAQSALHALEVAP